MLRLLLLLLSLLHGLAESENGLADNGKYDAYRLSVHRCSFLA